MINRRRFVKALNVALIAAVADFYKLPAFAAFYQNVDLKDVAAKVGLKFGSDSDIPFSKAPEAYRQLFAAQCNLLACMFIWKLDFPNAQITVPLWQDQNIRFAKDNALQLTGGHLLWHGSSPEWLKYTDNVQAAASVFIKFIATTYKDNMFSWNVVNEAVNPKEGRPDGLRHTVFLDKLGPSYFDFAFREAKKYAPDVLSVYNEYGVEMDTKEQEAKRTALIKLLDKFKKDGTPVDAVGLQSHLTLDGESRFNENVYRNFLNEISSRGFKILITELDVFDKVTSFSDIKARDQQVADLYKSFLSTALDNHAIKSVVTWGLCDKYTWLNPHYNPKFVRGDNQHSRPLPFDANLRPKPAYYAILNAFQHAPAR